MRMGMSRMEQFRVTRASRLLRGPGGHRGTLGGLGMGISKYAANRQQAIAALLELTGEAYDLQRSLSTDGIPSHTAVSERADVRDPQFPSGGLH